MYMSMGPSQSISRKKVSPFIPGSYLGLMVPETVRLLRETPTPLTGKDVVLRGFDSHD